MRAGSARVLAAMTFSCLLAFPAPALAGDEERKLRQALREAMRAAGPGSGAHVHNLGETRVLYKRRASRSRVLASNTKLFTTAAALDRFGTEAELSSTVRGDGQLAAGGGWDGDLFLVGGGDPTFGTAPYASRLDSGATVEALVDQLEAIGVKRVKGRVRGDESRFDSLRGGPASDYRTSVYVGPLSALSFNGGRAGGEFQSNPPKVAARGLTRALEKRGIAVRGAARVGTAPLGAAPLASVGSPTLAALVRRTNKPSDNFFAEMLTKELGAAGKGSGTTARGARRAERFAQELGAPAQIVDGSGLSRRNRAAPRAVVRLLVGLAAHRRFAEEFPAFHDSLPVAGRDGTLQSRMDNAASGRCSAKTGRLSGVSTLSGYCSSRGGDELVFSFLMSGVDTTRARRLQDRMAAALVRYRG